VGGSTAVDVQRLLNQNGYYSGPVDGIIGPASSAAISSYQSSNGLPVTGQIDQGLLSSLGL
jgi:peptidoglycan hydrolase-like protein with peptidoglycan-binding domain